MLYFYIVLLTVLERLDLWWIAAAIEVYEIDISWNVTAFAWIRPLATDANGETQDHHIVATDKCGQVGS